MERPGERRPGCGMARVRRLARQPRASRTRDRLTAPLPREEYQYPGQRAPDVSAERNGPPRVFARRRWLLQLPGLVTGYLGGDQVIDHGAWVALERLLEQTFAFGHGGS